MPTLPLLFNIVRLVPLNDVPSCKLFPPCAERSESTPSTVINSRGLLNAEKLAIPQEPALRQTSNLLAGL